MIATIAQRLRPDNGEASIIGTLAGAILFVTASIGVAGAVTLSLGASALAQKNSDLTATLAAEIQEWEKTPWGELEEVAAHEYLIDAESQTYRAYQQVTYLPDLNAFKLELSAPRVVAPGGEHPDCVDALTTTIPGCLSFSGTVAATSDDALPSAPAGITLVTEQIGAGTNVDNLIAGDFETAADSWTLTGSATVEQTNEPRTTGSHLLTLTGANGAASGTSGIVPVRTDDRLDFAVWVRADNDQGAIRLQAVWGYDGTEQTTTTNLATLNAADATGWLLIRGNAAATAGAVVAQLRILTVDGATECTATCAWAADDARVSSLARNIIDDPGSQAASWNTTGSFATVEAPNASPYAGTRTISVTAPGNGDAVSPGAAVTSHGEYVMKGWLRAETAAAASGIATIALLDQNGTIIASQDRALTGVGTAFTAISFNAELPESVTSTTIRITVAGMGATDPTVHFDDFSLVQSGALAGDPSTDGYIKLATFDGSEFEEQSSFRVSFQYLGTADTAPADLVAAVFCGDEAGAFEVSRSAMRVLDDSHGGTWLWSRLRLPELSRLQNCDEPILRIFSESGATPSIETISDPSVLRVLSGIKAQNPLTGGR